MLKRWKAGMDEMNRLDLEERRHASYSQRLASLAAIWRQAAFLGLLTPETVRYECKRHLAATAAKASRATCLTCQLSPFNDL